MTKRSLLDTKLKKSVLNYRIFAKISPWRPRYCQCVPNIKK